MYWTGEVFRAWEAVVEVVLPSGWTTSLKTVIFWPVESLVAIYVYRETSLLPARRILIEYGGQVKDSCGGMGYEVINLEAGI